MALVLADSNILLSIVQPSHIHHGVTMAAMDRLLEQESDLCVVTQNLVEFWVVATRPIDKGGFAMTPAIASSELRKLRSTFHLLDGMPGIADVWEELVSDQMVIGKPAHDAHLAMKIYGVQQVLTLNTGDFKRFDDIIALNPAEYISAGS